MRQAIVSVRFDDFPGIEEALNVYREAEILDMEVLSCDWTGGVIRIHVKEELDEQQLASDEAVVWCEEVAHSGQGHVYLIEMTDPEGSDLRPPDADDLLPVNFIDISDHEFTFDISGTQGGIRDAIARYQNADIPLVLQGLHDYRTRGDASSSLTERQREILEAAYERGYYEIPRGASTAELADDMGLDASTVAEHLQRAERNIMSSVLNE